MEKMWEVEMSVDRYYKNWRGKEIVFDGIEWSYCVMAETEEEAKTKAISLYKENNCTDFRHEYRFGRISNWDTWTVNCVLQRVCGKQLKMWAEQQGLLELMPLLSALK